MPRFPKWKLALKNTGALCTLATLFWTAPYRAHAQTVKIGMVSDFQHQLSAEDPSTQNMRKEGYDKSLKLATSNTTLSAHFTIHTLENGTEHFLGSVVGSKNSSVFFHFKNGKVEGKAILLKEKKAFIYSTNAVGEIEVEEEDIDKAICVSYDAQTSTYTSNGAASTLPPVGSTAYTLESLPGAGAVLMLDFDGEYVTNTPWNGESGTPIDAQPSDYTEEEITEIWQLISEDYRPFNINVTTNNAVFLAMPNYRRMKCIFTPTNTAGPTAGGIAYVGSFFWGDQTPCWVFNTGVKVAGESASHELGHTLGLSHDGRTNPVEDYYYGTANWAPIMGVGFGAQPVQWSKGEYAYANNIEDDINIISTTPLIDTRLGIGFRPDEAGDTEATAKQLVCLPSGEISATSENVGIIANRTDVDVYYFNTTGGTATINILATTSYPDLDVQFTLKNNSGNIIATINPATSMDASIVTVLSAGKYYILIDGVGKGDPSADGYSDYASIGQYKITGSVQQANTPPTVSLIAPVIGVYGAYYTPAPGTFELAASVSDVEGPIAKVEFYRDNVKIGEDAFYPGFGWNVTDLPVGTYSFTAKVFDQGGLTATSAPITVIVDGVSPTVSITAPSNNTQYVAPANFVVSAAPSDGQGPIQRVDFYQDGVLVGSDNMYPEFSYYTNNLPAGTYVFIAKAYDLAGLSTSSIPITVLVTAPACAVDEPTPAAPEFVLKNSWWDQNSGATVSNEAGALKVVQRAYGQNELWVLETGKTFNVTNGQDYTVKLDFKDYAAIGVTGIEAGFATGIVQNGSGPVLTGTTVSFPAGYSAANFTTKAVNISSSYTGVVFLAIKLKWSAQTTAQVTDYIKNLKICIGSGAQSRSDISDAATEITEGLLVSPNPSDAVFHTSVPTDVDLLHITDILGRTLYTATDLVKDATLSFGTDFNMGVYIVNVHYSNGTKESFKIVKAK